jgi:hypothetical protein
MAVDGGSLGALVGMDPKEPRGMRSRSSAVVLTSTGIPISSSCDLDELRDREADLLEVSFSFKHLKSANSGVDGICGEAEALRACRVTFGDKNVSGGGYVADRGCHGDGGGIEYEFGLLLPTCGESRECAGGTGFKYRSLGLRVKPSDGAELLRLCPSLGSSRTLRRWPGRRGQNVVEGSDGLWHSSSSSTLYCSMSIS